MGENLNDLRLSGAGNAGGGKFNNVSLSGACSVNGDIECTDLHCSGASEIRGSVKAKYIKTSGSSDIKGEVTAEEITISGASHIRGDVNTNNIKTSGSSEIKGNLSANKVEISGASEINGDCNAESFIARGGFDIGGLLNADNVDIEMDGKCRVREIGGEKIKVVEGHRIGSSLSKLLNNIFTSERKGLTVSIIEGDDIFLEYTMASIVRGNKVIIGKGCNIHTVEYKDCIEVNSNAHVSEQKKL